VILNYTVALETKEKIFKEAEAGEKNWLSVSHDNNQLNI
jgi:hypothetical protein